MGLRLSKGWAYRDVDLVVLPGELVAVLGPEEHRVPLVLTLAAELVPTAGRLRLCGHGIPAEIARARRRVAVAGVPDHVAGRPGTSVEECVRTTLVLADVPSDGDLFDAAADLVGFDAGHDVLVTELTEVDRLLLGIALAVSTPSELLVVVDADAGLDQAGRTRVWAALGAVSRTGTSVVTGAIEAPHSARVITMPTGTSNSVP